MKFLERFWFGCGHCHGPGEGCPVSEAIENGAIEGHPLGRGVPLVVCASAVFLGPLVLAMLGAWLAGRWFADAGAGEAPAGGLGVAQGVGAAVGLVIGLVVAKLVANLAQRAWVQAEERRT